MVLKLFLFFFLVTSTFGQAESLDGREYEQIYCERKTGSFFDRSRWVLRLQRSRRQGNDYKGYFYVKNGFYDPLGTRVRARKLNCFFSEVSDFIDGECFNKDITVKLESTYSFGHTRFRIEVRSIDNDSRLLGYAYYFSNQKKYCKVQ